MLLEVSFMFWALEYKLNGKTFHKYATAEQHWNELLLLPIKFVNLLNYILICFLLFPDYVSDGKLFQGYPPALLTFASIACVTFIFLGVPGNLITIIALARCKKVSLYFSYVDLFL